MNPLNESSNWKLLVDSLELHDTEAPPPKPIFNKSYSDTVMYLQQILGDSVSLATSLYRLCLAVSEIKMRVKPGNKKKQVTIEQLPIRGAEVYKEILYQCSEEDIIRIRNTIQTHQATSSGRTIDTLVTRFHHSHSTSYYLDVTDGYPGTIVKTAKLPNRRIILFDIGDAYIHKMGQYSKNYFDCFARGDEVLHQLKNGSIVSLSLCQFMFFYWAEAFRVLDFLQSEQNSVVSLRKKNQQLKTQSKNQNKKIRKCSIFVGSSVAILAHVHPAVKSEGGFVHVYRK